MVLKRKRERSRLLYGWENIFFKLSRTNPANMSLFKMNSGNTNATCEICSKLTIRHHRSSRPEVFLEKGVLKIYGKFTGGHPCRSVILIKLLCNFFEIALRYGCSPVNLLHVFRKAFLKNTSVGLLLTPGQISHIVLVSPLLPLDK